MIPTWSDFDFGKDAWVTKTPTPSGRHFMLTVQGKAVLTEVTRVHRMEETETGTRLVFNDGTVTRYMDVSETFMQVHKWFDTAGLLR